MKNLSIALLLVYGLLLGSCDKPGQEVAIYADMEIPQLRFATEEIRTVLTGKGKSVITGSPENARIVFRIQPDHGQLEEEGFHIRPSGEQVEIIAASPAGSMYGGMELAEQIAVNGLDQVEEITRNPYMELRGAKFNIPLDVRTPSYTDACDAAQHNIPEMWSFDFWKEYLDNMARYRYNFISLWSLHPFPSMVKVPDYPDIALDNVLRSTVNWKENYALQGTGYDAPEILNNVEVVREISIEEKMNFWRRVMAYAKDRNIDFYVITWNIFINGTRGQYGITDDIDNQTTQDYFRKSIRQLFITYPDLAGVGLTTGENMHGADFDKKEDWAFDTYAMGMLDAAAEMPDRQFTLIHRQHQAGAKEIARKFKPVMEQDNAHFLFSFKYAKAHVFSSTRQPYHRQFVRDIGDLKTIWTLRNDDNYYFRWGAPDFVREFIRNIPYEVSRGFYYGSDQWVWGREFLMKDPEGSRQIEVVKHWYHWMMWGRLGYDPGMSNERFVQILQYHFPGAEAEKLFTAWQEASMIYPTTTGFHWGPLDFQWYIEACKSRPGYARTETGFHDVNRFITLDPHPLSGNQSIPDYVKMVQEGGQTGLTTPAEVAKKLHDHADKALELIGDMDAGEDRELAYTLNDIKTMAYLGRYYGYKIGGATNLALYRATQESVYQRKAVEQLSSALEAWKNYTGTALKQNKNPLWTNRVGHVDWKQITGWVENDITIAQSD